MIAVFNQVNIASQLALYILYHDVDLIKLKLWNG
jgi:hypothetical protein